MDVAISVDPRAEAVRAGKFAIGEQSGYGRSAKRPSERTSFQHESPS